MKAGDFFDLPLQPNFEEVLDCNDEIVCDLDFSYCPGDGKCAELVSNAINNHDALVESLDGITKAFKIKCQLDGTNEEAFKVYNDAVKLLQKVKGES